MDPSACKVIYIDDRFNTNRWITREGHSTVPQSPVQKRESQANFEDLPGDLQANVNAILTVFNQVFVCCDGKTFSSQLAKLHESVKIDCTPIIACFDVGSEGKHDHSIRLVKKFSPASAELPDSPGPSPLAKLRREMTFSTEENEAYGVHLLSQIASDLQVDEDNKLVIPIAIVKPQRKDSYDQKLELHGTTAVSRSPYGSETAAAKVVDTSDAIDPQMMLQCLEAGALDVVKSPLDKAGIMGLTVHAYRRHKVAKKEQAAFMATARRNRKSSWVGVEDNEQPYAYLREAMVRKLLRGICEPTTTIETSLHSGLVVQDDRKPVIEREIGNWSFCGHDFNEHELVYAGCCMLNHALQMPELEKWRIDQDELLHFMHGCRVAYNHFVLYHNFRHAVDVLQSVFYFLLQIGILPPYPRGSQQPPLANQKSAIAKLLSPFEAMTLLISAIGHDVGHPGVNNMFLVKLNAPLAQLYNDQSVLEAFHCAAYSQILRRHWPVAFNDKALRKLMISSILATDMGVHADYMQQLSNLQEKIHHSQTTDGWSPKDVEAFRTLTCGLLIKCADISNVARPWDVAEKWTHLLQREFANQGEMEQQVGIETTLFGGPPELGNMLKLANGQIGFMTIFAHPLFANVADIIPAMSSAAEEILTNKGVWFTRAEQEKRRDHIRHESVEASGAVSPRSQSPLGGSRRLPGDNVRDSYFPRSSPLQNMIQPQDTGSSKKSSAANVGQAKASDSPSASRRSSLAAVAGTVTPGNEQASRRSSGASRSALQPPRRPSQENKGSNNTSASQRQPKETRGKAICDEDENPNRSIESAPDALQQYGSTDGALDERRDTEMSMRAGTVDLPFLDSGQQPSSDRGLSPLSKFKFATNKIDEPVREYSPEQHYPPIHQSARASMPTNDSRHQVAASTAASQSTSSPDTDAGELQSATSDAMTPTGGQSGSRPTSSTQSDFERKQARAASAPTQAGQQQQQQSGMDSLRSFGFGSRESSKQDVHMTTIVNGEVVEGGEKEGGDEKKERSGGTMRRRSRIRLKFWKKKDKDVTGEAGGEGDDESVQS